MTSGKHTLRNVALVAGGAALVAGVAATVGVALVGAALWKRLRGADLSRFGHESETALTRSFVTKLGRDAAERFHETA